MIIFPNGMQFTGDVSTRYFGVGSETAPSSAFTVESDTGVYLDSPGVNSAYTITKRGRKRFRIDDDKTQIIGPIEFDGGTSSSLSLPDGSESAPALSFTDHPLTGLYFDDGKSSMVLATGPSNNLYVDNSLTVPDGQVTGETLLAIENGFLGGESVGLGSDGGTGMYYDSGTKRLHLSSDSNDVLALQSNGQVLAQDGSDSIPSFAFSGGTSSGLSNFGGDIHLSVGGSARMKIKAAITEILGGVSSAGGTFSDLTSTSLNVGTGTINTSGSATVGALFSTSVTSSGTMSGTTITSSTAFRGPDGSLTQPSFSFTNATSSGMYESAGDVLISSNGVPRVQFGSSTANFPGSVTAGSGSFGAITGSSLGLGSGTLQTTGAASVGALTSTSLSLGSGTLSTSGSASVGALTSTSHTNTGTILNADGASSAPSYAFTNGTGSGMYWNNGISTLSFAIGGTTKATLSTALLNTGTLPCSFGGVTAGSLQLSSGTLSTSGACTTGALTSTSITASGNVTLNGGTASGYVTTNGSKVLTTTASPTSWTPTLGDGTNNVSGGTAIGSYYQIGPIVIAFANLTWTAKTSVSGSIAINLPVVAGATYGLANITYNSNISFTGSYLQGLTNPSFASAQLIGFSNAGVATPVTDAQIGTTGWIMYTAIYSAV